MSNVRPRRALLVPRSWKSSAIPLPPPQDHSLITIVVTDYISANVHHNGGVQTEVSNFTNLMS